ncbi:FG-GAP repeat domain-containing protein [Nannocystis punicea]|uniref:VCBS repeat-containing protein n=1 Tax=Nannocystis punicea TaxID=2995304 RepID=A0ABY7H8S9_9BACT|nr:VCBS repeat-containing protein [Nannocystis poenicansa]WAS95676.1 VCBS repeat-containing protein [Nannocystis poenicansa]
MCTDERWLDLATRVADAAAVDLDGDGEDEMVALTGDTSRQVVVGGRTGWRSAMLFAEVPLAVAPLDGEFAVLFDGVPLAAIFGVDGDGRLERRRDIPLPDVSLALVSGDLDGDGRRELIAGLHKLGEVAVIDPRTGAVRTYPAGKGPSRLALGDVDGDSHLDVVGARDGALQVLRGAGDGALMPASTSTARTFMLSVALADHDGDGDLDALTRGLSESVELHRNDGTGRLSSPTSLPFNRIWLSGQGLAAAPVATGGLAGVSVPGGEVLTTWYGKGAAWLGRTEDPLHRVSTWVGGGTDSGMLVGGEGFVTRYAYARGMAPLQIGSAGGITGDYGESALVTGDLDGDHLLDVVASGSGQVRVYRGRAEPGLQALAAWSQSSALSLAIAELTGDGLPDVLVAGEQSLSVALGSEGGPQPPGSPVPTNVTSRALTPLRTGPDTPAVVVAVPANHHTFPPELAPAAVLRFAADGSLLEERVLGEGLAAAMVIAVDFDGDGVDEPLILGTRDEAPVLVHASPDGEGYSLGVEHDLTTLSGVSAEDIRLHRLAAGDIDDDGAPEVLLMTNGGAIVVSGMLDDAPVALLSPDIGGPSHLHDIDGDGRLDAVQLGSFNFYYQRGLGAKRFETEGSFARLADGMVLALASRPDAQFDLVSLGEEGVQIHLFRDVVRPVEAEDPFNFHGDVAELAAADIDQDGYDDLVTVCRREGGGLSVLWGSEDAALTRADGVNGDNPNGGIAIGDLDGDGAPELISAVNGYAIELHRLGPAGGQSLLLDLLGSLEKVEDLAIDDVDHDGLPDVLALAYILPPWDQLTLYVAYGTEPLSFGPWTQAAAVVGLERGALEVGDVDGDGAFELLIRPPSQRPALLIRPDGPRTWAEPETIPGTTALFSPRGADGRVELLSHEGTTVYRHVDGDPQQRVALVQHESLVEGALRQVGDADADGRYDLVTTEDAGTFVWLLGDDRPAKVRVSEHKLAAVQFPDIDGDGRPDIVGVGNYNLLFVRTTRR